MVMEEENAEQKEQMKINGPEIDILMEALNEYIDERSNPHEDIDNMEVERELLNALMKFRNAQKRHNNLWAVLEFNKEKSA